MSLFIGNLNYEITEKEISDLFLKYGKCKINYKGSFAFATYEDQKEAEKAKEVLNKKKIGSREINVEWCKSKPRNRDNRDRDRDRDRDNRETDRYRNYKDIKGKCYVCNKYGHYARDCPDSKRRYVSSKKYHGQYSRYSRRSRSPSRSKNNYSHKKRSWRNDLDRSRSSSRKNNRNYDRRRKVSDSWEKNSFGSKSRSWSRSRNQSRSKSKSWRKNGDKKGGDRSPEKNRERSKDRERDGDKDRDKYKCSRSQSRNRSKSTSWNRENSYDKKDKINGGKEHSEDSWGCEKEKVEDLKE